MLPAVLVQLTPGSKRMIRVGSGAVGAGDADTMGAVQDLSTQYKVTVTGVDSIAFDPRGFGASFGDTTSVTLSRNSHSETISLDGLGRVLK